MLKYIEKTGATEDEAIAAALEELHLSRDDVSVEIVERATKGFLGIGRKDAKVKVSYEVPDEKPAKPERKPEPEKKPQPEKKPEPEKKPQPERKPEPEKKPQPEKKPEPKKEKKEKKPQPVSDENLSEKAAKLGAFLEGLFQRMGVEAGAAITENAAEGVINVELYGQKVGALIGRRGETLDAIQHLSNYVINSGDDARIRINIDAENYRAKRAESLDSLAKKTAEKVVKYRKNKMLEPMNAYERHVIHTALQDYPNVTTYSTGTEPNRRVVIAYEGAGEPVEEKPQRRERRGGGRRERSSAPKTTELKEPVVKETKPTREWC
ncbi:MAG: protein jag [Oscillospiraceae bacterium]|nr:protein jag [Oscillospiraceae bacterium]